jgi:predicted metal-dependent hydrolase
LLLKDKFFMLGSSKLSIQEATDWAKAWLMPNLNRIHPDLQLRVSKQARRMTLRLDTKKRVVFLVVPSRTRVDKAYKFAWDNRTWIHNHLNELPQPIGFLDGAVIPICGEDVTICVNFAPDLRSTTFEFDDNTLIVNTNKEDPSGRIERFLKEHAKDALSGLAFKKAEKLGRTLRHVGVRDTKSRWGSCNNDGEIMFSWRLIFAPREAMDYVVAHEVAHLEHLDHSPEFWSVCRMLSTSYTKGKSWMAANGHELMRYGTTIH